MPCYVAWAQKPTKRISIRSPITCLFSGCIFLRDISKTFKYNLIGLLISNRLSSAHLCIHSILCVIKHKICLFCWINIFLWLYMMISTDKHYIKLSNRWQSDWMKITYFLVILRQNTLILQNSNIQWPIRIISTLITNNAPTLLQNLKKMAAFCCRQ